MALRDSSNIAAHLTQTRLMKFAAGHQKGTMKKIFRCIIGHNKLEFCLPRLDWLEFSYISNLKGCPLWIIPFHQGVWK